MQMLARMLWATLACPTDRLNLPEKFLQLLDENGDQRIAFFLGQFLTDETDISLGHERPLEALDIIEIGS